MDAGVDLVLHSVLSSNLSLLTQTSALNHHAGSPLIDKFTLNVLRVFNYNIIGFAFGTFGIAANIINIAVFVRQGLFSGGGTLNLFFLSIVDLGVVVTVVLTGVFVIFIVWKVPGFTWDPFAILYLFIGWPLTMFMVANRILTAYIAFERCMCVLLPFHVQRMFAPRRSMVYITCIFAYTFISHIPIFMTHRLGNLGQEGTNVTKLVLVFGHDRDYWHDVVYYANFFTVSLLSVVVVLVCSVLTSTHVTTSKKWRKSVSSNNTVSDETSTRDSSNVKCKESGAKGEKTNAKTTKASKDKEAKLVKMITTISTIFLVCYIPMLSLIFMTAIDDRIRTRRQYENLYHAAHGVTFACATINSSINIFVYYTMSSNYRKVFLSYFGRDKSGGVEQENNFKR